MASRLNRDTLMSTDFNDSQSHYFHWFHSTFESIWFMCELRTTHVDVMWVWFIHWFSKLRTDLSTECSVPTQSCFMSYACTLTIFDLIIDFSSQTQTQTESNETNLKRRTLWTVIQLHNNIMKFNFRILNTQSALIPSLFFSINSFQANSFQKVINL